MRAPVAFPTRVALLLAPFAGLLLLLLLLWRAPLSCSASSCSSSSSPRRGAFSRAAARVPQLSALGAGTGGEAVRRRLRAACALCARDAAVVDVARLRSYGPAYSSIVVSHALKVVYVPVFKAATTATMWQMAYLERNARVLAAARSQLDVALHDMAHPAWRRHAIHRWPSHRIRAVLRSPAYLKFGFVRNPYHRLVSAYVDKIHRPAVHSPEYQAQMYSLFGHDLAARAAANRSKPSFQHFVATVSVVLSQPRAGSAHQPLPFEDNRSRRDLHWRPQVELLHPDIIPFDFIGTFDNLHHDRRLVLQWMYQHTTRRIPSHLLEKRHATNPAHKQHLYKLIRHNHSLRQRIIQTYKQDFETFNFSTLPPSSE
eukprot:gb/GEZJ01004334.1/.p1 GENE.gb/GEZJ01004334.1/~~gb/GEZJ01004334.1/.p1  ORF type:complete len:371 (+),score=48.74 gb/GEZJ01004334.1/:320-1432(+)